MIQELKKHLPKKKCFKKRMQMLHFVASTDYEDVVEAYRDRLNKKM